jgi:hypothetical protein
VTDAWAAFPHAHQLAPAAALQALALAITQVPLSLMDALLFSGVTYFMVSAAAAQRQPVPAGCRKVLAALEP